MDKNFRVLDLGVYTLELGYVWVVEVYCCGEVFLGKLRVLLGFAECRTIHTPWVSPCVGFRVLGLGDRSHYLACGSL